VGVAVLNRKPAISLKWPKMGQNRTKVTVDDQQEVAYTRFRLIPKSVTLDDLERPFRTVSKYMRLSSTPRKSE